MYSDSVKALSGAGRNGSDDLPGTDHCYFSLVTMWVVRVGLGYLMAIPMGLGLEGVWIAMCTEWAVKTVAFGLRFRGEKWLAHSDRMDKM